jgi:hypothetical protein
MQQVSDASIRRRRCRRVNGRARRVNNSQKMNPRRCDGPAWDRDTLPRRFSATGRRNEPWTAAEV